MPTQTSFLLPQISCPFNVSYHPNGDVVAAASDKWFEGGSDHFTEAKRRRLYEIKAGQLTAYCYNDADDNRLRVVCDFINILFHLDDLFDNLSTRDTVAFSDVVMNALTSPHAYRIILPSGTKLPEAEPEASRIVRDFWGRCIADMAPSVQARFCENMNAFLKSLEAESKSRGDDSLPSIAEFMSLRRDNGGCRPSFDLLEYSFGIELPDFVMDDPSITLLSDCANDFIALTNDIFSYNVEQSRGDTYNVVVIVMKSFKLDLQGAVDHIGNMCRETLELFQATKASLPSWNVEVDKDVALYIKGLEDWMSGSLHWSLFVSERYFPPSTLKDGVVTLLPQRARSNAA
ncbi:terpenoid synthase [Hysterangium stoloniferum]|nr:terpenoid synthase [Hysterangium stoloniferum]